MVFSNFVKIECNKGNKMYQNVLSSIFRKFVVESTSATRRRDSFHYFELLFEYHYFLVLFVITRTKEISRR